MHRPWRKRFTGIVFLAILLMGRSSAFAADKWISLQSKNFLFVGNASESQIRKVARNLEEFRAAFGELFPATVQKNPPPITVIVFKDDNAFRPFKPLYQGKPANVAGFFQADKGTNFIALTGDIQTPHVIYHEFVHALTKDIIQLPPWASEGLAEFYGNFEIESGGKQILLGRPMAEHVLMLRQQLFPLDQLFAVDHSSPLYNERSKQGTFYAESWALIHYLMLGDNKKHGPQLQKFLALLINGKAIDDSFTEAFQTDYAALGHDLTAYIQKFAFPMVRYNLQNKIDFDRDMRVMPVSDAQAQYYLGDLLLHMNRLDAAESQLTKAISMDPKLGSAYASMGLLRIRQEKYEEGLKFLTQALEAGSNDYLVHYYFAYLIQLAGHDPDPATDRTRFVTMKEHLKQSIALAPEHAEAYDLLGYVALNLADEIQQTEDVLKTIVNTLPARRDLRLRLAEVMIMNKEVAAARAILAPLRKGSDHDMIQQEADRLTDNIQAQLDNEALLREFEERRRASEVEANTAVTAGNDDKTSEEPPTLTRKDTSSDPNDHIVETMKVQLKRPEGPQIQGLLTSMDCVSGVTLHVSVENKVIDLHSDDPSKIEFVSYTTGVSDLITCGPLNPALAVTIIYKPGTGTRFLGEPVRVEFTAKK